MRKHPYRRSLLAALLCLVLLISSLSIADAGNFAGDSDWGSSSSDWSSSSSDWGSSSSSWSSSSWDSDWDNDSSYDDGWFFPSIIIGNQGPSGGSSGGGGIDLFEIVLILLIIIIVIRYLRSRKQEHSGAQVYQASEEEPGLPIETLKQKDPNFNEQKLLEKVSNDYVRMQQCWQAKDWEPMRAVMTDQLYNQMLRQLDELKRNTVTNYVERIAVLNTRIMRYAVEGDNDVLVVRLQSRICDYTLDDETGNLVSGSRTRELFMTYDWKLIRQKDQKTRDEAHMTQLSCPNCGAPLDINQSGKCPYCGSVITLSDHDWALSSIKGISQRSAN